jgi:acyl dehydratase
MYYAEDLTVGQIYPTGTYEVTTEDIMSFARQWDPVPIHLDEAVAAASPFGGLIASGMHTMAIAVKIAYVNFWDEVALMAGRGIRDMKLRNPVRPGMTLRGQIDIIEQRLRDDGRGVVVVTNQLFDQATDDLIIRFEVDTLVYRRGADS